MDLSCKPRQKSDYRLEKIDDELLLYHPNQTVIMYCNPSASLIWQLCDGERTVEEISSLLSAAYEQPLEGMTSEVTKTLQQFHQRRAIEYPGEEDKRKSG
jgi:hypothetical protein